MDYFPLEGFNHVIKIGVLICDIFVWSCYWRCSVFWEYFVYQNMVSELLWRVTFGFDQDLEPVLPKLWKGFWFWIFCAFLAYKSCYIASGAPLLLGNNFHFLENRFCLIQKHPFQKIWRYNVTVTDLFIYFLNLLDFINFIIRSLLF